jgi:SAM-dependent methyltransferase
MPPPSPRDAADALDRATLGRVGFETASDVYERARPDYADQAVDALTEQARIGRGTRVLDLAAGTGKLTRRLHALGAACVAVEPSASMRQVFADVLPEVPVMGGTAEAVPVGDQQVEAVVVAQAFHWFDPPAALAEIARVLRPGGTLSLIWNERDDTDPMVAQLVTLSRWDRHQPYPVGMDFGRVIDDSRRFGPVTRTRSAFVQPLGREAFVEQVASRSYVQVLEPADRARLLGDVERMAATLAEPIGMPYLSDLFTATLRS